MQKSLQKGAPAIHFLGGSFQFHFFLIILKTLDESLSYAVRDLHFTK